ncbi:FAD-dependent oxidoreductase [Pseudarthrobacter sp. MDT3-26]|uniref:FAD-dependent oxidoreductase n=1 Tax=Pseudarthrobacter raffinosi TaxID=2953651 RepID=UPI00208DFAB6|nr:FAD-dependent oxidoreductase [Pseudarthrobacter sp. MDT3-26]MCO4261949.1 FAD-dependent oxidoreductase [Pseudarthrobacter sp. MDT3-26]
MNDASNSGRPEGEPRSLWVATAGTTDYPVLRGDLEVDFAVIGAGIAGLTAALALKRTGRTVAVIETARIGTGVTGHTTGKVTSLHRLAYTELARRHSNDTARIYGEANQAAVEHVAQLVAEEAIDCDFRRVANYTYAESDDALSLVRAEANLAARLGLPAAFTTDVPLPFPVKGAVRFDGQAQIHAVKYLRGLARAVNGEGSFVYEQTRAQQVHDGSPAVVDTEHGTVRARGIIVATNVPWGGQGLFYLRSHPHRSYLVAGRVDTPPLDATFISADEPMRSILTTSVNGTSYVLTGGEGHRVSEPGDTAARYRRLAAFAHDRLGVEKIAYRWSTQDGIPLDGLPYAGLMSPAAKHVYVITGLRKWGLSNGTAAALILADTLSGRENPWASVFNSNRFTPAASAKRFAEENFKTVAAVLASKLRRRPSHSDLSPGEGTVIKVNGESTAVYKDADGQVHAVSATCTHLGCTVGFNTAETTWDCPCHGSRFSTDGTVIQGPAAKNLPPAQMP